MPGTHFIRRSVIATTDASGDATVFLPDAAGTAATGGSPDPLGPLNGEVRAVIYAKTDFDDGVDFTITAEGTGLGVWTEANVNASKTVHPLVPASDQVGVAMLYAAAGEAVPAGPPILASERLKIVVASGGNVKTGKFTAIIG
jgi:hypothetical protein